MSDIILEVEELSVIYQSNDQTVYAVSDLSFKLHKGRTLGIVGETGAGKTTTALSILRILPDPPAKITKGKIVFDGINLLELDKKKMRTIRGYDIAMIFQDPMTSLDPVYTVGKQIEEMILLHESISKSEAWKKSEEMLELVGIDKTRANDYPHQFSGGMQQRVVIAIALACNPRLLIADEPTTALDVTIQAQVLDLMTNLKKKIGMSMILITHDLGVVSEICDDVAIMYAGEIVETGSVGEVYKNPCHPYTIALFDSLPNLNEEQFELNVISGSTPDPTNIPKGCSFHPRCKYYEPECSSNTPKLLEVSAGHLVRCLRTCRKETSNE